MGAKLHLLFEIMHFFLLIHTFFWLNANIFTCFQKSFVTLHTRIKKQN